jgi:hypothetical protein
MEAERAKGSSEQTTGDGDNLPAVEFYYGKVKQNEKWIKTGKIYWIFTTYQKGKRKRLSPSRIYGKKKGITSIEECPFEGRVHQFYWRSLGVGTTGGSGNDGRFQGVEGRNRNKLASQ